MSEHKPLTAYLTEQGQEIIPMTFQEIEKVSGRDLPPSAFKYPAWWSNNPRNNPLTHDWLNAGYKTKNVNMENQKLVFQKSILKSIPNNPSSNEGKFSWVNFYEAIANKLLPFKEQRNELVEKIYGIASRTNAPFSSLQDIYPDGSKGPLKDICPFTTMGTFNRGITNENRRIIAEELAKSLRVEEPLPLPFSHDGIPVLDNRNSWFFKHERDRQPNDISLLWNVFESGIKLTESDGSNYYLSDFANALDNAISIAGGWKLTIGLYWIRPFDFPSLDSRSRKYISAELGMSIPDTLSSANSYLEIREKLKNKFKEEECPVHSFPELSLAAWLTPATPSDKQNEPDMGPNKKSRRENDTETTKNLILYGPPGTGKTYKLNELKQEYSGGTQTLNRKAWLIQELRKASWFEVIFAALYDLGKREKVSAISEHEYVQAKAESVGRVKHVKNTIWAVLQSHAPEDSESVKFQNRGQHPAVFDKNESSFWSLVNDWEEECKDIVELSRRWKGGPDQESANKRFEFVTFHQAYSYEDFIEGLRPGQDEETGNIKYDIVPGVFKNICSSAKEDPEQRYAIFIDEINRGNIASIFGELITLIETDKRVVYGEDGSPESGITLTLPYSGEHFGIPANLDVYGTMNTADRSIALIDTALRRRFQFQEMMPDTSVIKGSSGDGLIEDGEGETIDLRRLLETINRRVRFLLSRDMTIGHSYLINVRNFDELKDVLLSRIIPLLQEYFYDDWHRIQLVFKDVGPSREKIQPQIIRHEQLKKVEILGFDHDDFEDSIEYWVAPENEITPDAIRKIYEEST